MHTFNYSLSDLLKKSAKQLCYLQKENNRKEHKTNSFITNEDSKKYFNMRGTYEYAYLESLINIHYVIDTLEVNDLGAFVIEKKNIVGAYELWYKQYAILQAATIQAFLKLNKNKVLQTASFCVDRGEPAMMLNLKNRFINAELHLGKKELLTIYVSEPEKLVQYILAKVVASFSYTTAEAWDAMHKFKDFEFLHTAITYRSKYDKKAS